jgi:hypothetical protein
MSQLVIVLSVMLSLCASMVGAPADAQTSVDPSPQLLTLARQMPGCREFRNDCQVCIRLPDGKLGCSNIGIACTPNGSWRCSIPAQSEENTK